MSVLAIVALTNVPATAPATAPPATARAAAVNLPSRDIQSRAGRHLERGERDDDPSPAASPVPTSKPHAQSRPATAATRRSAPAPRPPAPRPPSRPSAGAAGIVVAFVLAQLGKPYRFGAAGPSAFDCSGLVEAAYARAGIDLPHSTGGIAGRGSAVTKSALQPGDVVFPSSGHVGVYIGGGQMVHAPHTGTVVQISSVYSFWIARRLL